jgi:hypothetical protein
LLFVYCFSKLVSDLGVGEKHFVEPSLVSAVPLLVQVFSKTPHWGLMFYGAAFFCYIFDLVSQLFRSTKYRWRGENKGVLPPRQRILYPK